MDVPRGLPVVLSKSLLHSLEPVTGLWSPEGQSGSASRVSARNELEDSAGWKRRY